MAFALLEDLYGASRTDVLRGKDKEFSAEEHNDFDEIVKKTAAGLPMQYATGRALFAGRYFKVTPDTLIPRPETVYLAELQPPPAPRAVGADTSLIAGFSEAVARGRTVLDCGTGSGCIAITIALEHPDWAVEAWDISEGALAVARDNAAALGAANVTFARRDILAEAREAADILAGAREAADSLCGQYGAIVSNPPYICDSEAAEMEAHVLDYEPHSALFVPDDDPLVFYRALATIALARLVPGGCLIVECNRAYTQAVARLFADHGLEAPEVLPDCFDAPRFVRATQPQS